MVSILFAQWQPASSLSNANIANPVATPPAGTTTYSVNILETTCNSSTTLSTTVTVNPLPLIRANKSNDLDCSNDRSQLNATGAQTYIWSPVATLDNSLISNPIATPSVNTLYIVKGTDASDCTNLDSVMVDVLSSNTSGYHMPNAFTPNNDGLNDCYGIRFWGVIQELDFSIYNRWGERIFFTKNPTDCWNGTYKGKMQDIGVYVYMIRAKTLCGETFKKVI
jgi:gliding motility-associated-like protein